MSAQAASGDRIGASLLFAVLVHALLILGITFVAPRPGTLLPTLDVILVERQLPKAPEQPDFLAQANQARGRRHARARAPHRAALGAAAAAGGGRRAPAADAALGAAATRRRGARDPRRDRPAGSPGAAAPAGTGTAHRP
ncbi:MAG: hypothetical protein RML12_05310 [Xanthomonadales bacterium]|nr:hypothetical protein [Xanthomonadales bacterium]